LQLDSVCSPPRCRSRVARHHPTQQACGQVFQLKHQGSKQLLPRFCTPCITAFGCRSIRACLQSPLPSETLVPPWCLSLSSFCCVPTGSHSIKPWAGVFSLWSIQVQEVMLVCSPAPLTAVTGYLDFELVRGNFKVPLLKGEVDLTLSEHRDIEHTIHNDLDNWLCNLYVVLP